MKLQPQPARVLAILASSPGEVIERDEIRRLVWGDSFLDFDANLNFCIKQIRQALGDSATAPRFIETLPRRGYRFLMPVSQEEPQAPAPPQPQPQARKKLWVPLLSVAVMAGILVFLLGSRAHPTPPRLVVLPFECQDPSQAAVCGGITEAVTDELTKRFPKDLEVIASSSARVYAGKSLPEIARELKVTHVLSGEVMIAGGQIRMIMRLASTARRWELRQNHSEMDLRVSDVPSLYAQVVYGVARELRLPIPPPTVRPTRQAKPSSEAYEAYLRGRYLMSQAQVGEAVSSFQNAVLLEPTFAQAYAALAHALDAVEKPLCPDMPLIDAAARRAIELDPDLANAHLALAFSLFHCHLDWEEAGREFQKALALDPGNAKAYSLHAFYLTSLGRHDEAISAANKARELDPASMIWGSDYAYLLYLAGRYKEAIRESRRALDLISISPEPAGLMKAFEVWTLWVLFQSALRTGDKVTAVEAGKDMMESAGEGQQTAGVQTPEDFLRWYETYLQRKKSTRTDRIAMTSVGLGRHKEALDTLETDCRTRRSYILLFTGAEPTFDPLRGDPRFERILDCIRLPADAPARRDMLKAAAAGSARGDRRPPGSSTGS